MTELLAIGTRKGLFLAAGGLQTPVPAAAETQIILSAAGG